MSSIQLSELETDQLVTFKLAKEELALPIHLVQEIVKPPEITRVPNAPSYIEGIGNLRGNILPVINLRERLGLQRKESDENTRIVVLRTRNTITGLVVDCVQEVMRIEKDILEPPPESVSDVHGKFLQAIAKVNQGKRLVLILNEEEISPQIEPARLETRNTESDRASLNHQAASELHEEEHLVTFRLQNEEFAIDIMKVQEIIRVMEINEIPGAPPFISGVMSLRNKLLPIMDLRRRFGLPEYEATASQQDAQAAQGELDARRIIVADVNGVHIGLQVDSVSEVLRLEKSKIEPTPSIIGEKQAEFIKSVGKLNNGERLIMLLNVSRLIREQEKQQLLETTKTQDQTQERTMSHDRARDEEVQLVCFYIGDEEYGINIMKVQEIIRVDQITSVPRAPEFIQGIVNLRGNILPVIDMRTRFGLSRTEITEQNRIVVVDICGKTTGLIVDSVSEVLRTTRSNIEAPPAAITNASSRFIQGVGKLNQGKRIILLIDADLILSNDESEALSSFHAEEDEKAERGSTEEAVQEAAQEQEAAMDAVEQ